VGALDFMSIRLLGKPCRSAAQQELSQLSTGNPFNICLRSLINIGLLNNSPGLALSQSISILLAAAAQQLIIVLRSGSTVSHQNFWLQ
jgi:hypothetical protein